MKISELIASTKKVPRRGTFANKPFGEIYSANKRTELNAKNNVLTVSMLIKAVTDKIDGKPVAAHRVMIKISNIKADTISFNDLADKVRNSNSKYASLDDYKDNDLVQIAMNSNKEEGGNVFFPDKTLFKNEPAGYSIVDNKIPDNSQIQVWCSCSDYYWTFLYYNIDNGVNIGGNKGYAGKYNPKTIKGWEARKSDTPLRNPGKHPGMCKHLMLLLSMLMDEEVVEATSNSAKSILNQYNFNINRFTTMNRITERQFNNLTAKYEKDYGKQQRRRRRESKSNTKSRKAHFWASHNTFKNGSWRSK